MRSSLLASIAQTAAGWPFAENPAVIIHFGWHFLSLRLPCHWGQHTARMHMSIVTVLMTAYGPGHFGQSTSASQLSGSDNASLA